MHKRTETTEKTRQNLIDAFWALYTTTRIEKITVRAITNNAGYNRGTFYEYFRDVYDLLAFIENQSLPTLDELPPRLEQIMYSPTFISSFWEMYHEKYKYYSVLLGDTGDPAFQRKLKNNLKSSLMQVLSTRQGVNLEEIDLMLEYILSGLIGVMIYSFQQKTNMPKEEYLRMVYRLVQGDMVNNLRTLMG